MLTAGNSARSLGGGESEEGAGGGKQDAAPALRCSESEGEIIHQCEPGVVKQSSLRSLKGCGLNTDWEAPKSFCLVWRKEIPEGFQEKVPVEIGLWKRCHLEVRERAPEVEESWG